jgi:hypothetical protein
MGIQVKHAHDRAEQSTPMRVSALDMRDKITDTDPAFFQGLAIGFSYQFLVEIHQLEIHHLGIGYVEIHWVLQLQSISDVDPADVLYEL